MRSRLKGMETLGSYTKRYCIALTCEVRSRLKGMETGSFGPFPIYQLQSSLSPRSRLKGMETYNYAIIAREIQTKTLDLRSRLKGMETRRRNLKFPCNDYHFGSAFPFEGNGNCGVMLIVSKVGFCSL